MPSLFALLDAFYPKLQAWEDQRERDVYRLGAGVALEELPGLLASPNPPEFVTLAIKENRIDELKRRLERAHNGTRTLKSRGTRLPRDQIPFYFRSKAEKELCRLLPDYFELEEGWSLIVHEISTRFTKEFSNPYGTFDDELQDYCHARWCGDLKEPTEFSIEVSKLNDKAVGDEIYSKLREKFPTIAAALGPGLLGALSLPNLLCALYAYHVRLQDEFAAEEIGRASCRERV